MHATSVVAWLAMITRRPARSAATGGGPRNSAAHDITRPATNGTLNDKRRPTTTANQTPPPPSWGCAGLCAKQRGEHSRGSQRHKAEPAGVTMPARCDVGNNPERSNQVAGNTNTKHTDDAGAQPASQHTTLHALPRPCQPWEWRLLQQLTACTPAPRVPAQGSAHRRLIDFGTRPRRYTAVQTADPSDTLQPTVHNSRRTGGCNHGSAASTAAHWPARRRKNVTLSSFAEQKSAVTKVTGGKHEQGLVPPQKPAPWRPHDQSTSSTSAGPMAPHQPAVCTPHTEKRGHVRRQWFSASKEARYEKHSLRHLVRALYYRTARHLGATHNGSHDACWSHRSSRKGAVL